MAKQVLLIPKIFIFIIGAGKINLLHHRVTFLMTFEFLDLRLAGIFLSTAIASPLTSEMNIETVEDNEPTRCSCRNHTVSQSQIALLTTGRC